MITEDTTATEAPSTPDADAPQVQQADDAIDAEIMAILNGDAPVPTEEASEPQSSNTAPEEAEAQAEGAPTQEPEAEAEQESDAATQDAWAKLAEYDQKLSQREAKVREAEKLIRQSKDLIRDPASYIKSQIALALGDGADVESTLSEIYESLTYEMIGDSASDPAIKAQREVQRLSREWAEKEKALERKAEEARMAAEVEKAKANVGAFLGQNREKFKYAAAHPDGAARVVELAKEGMEFEQALAKANREFESQFRIWAPIMGETKPPEKQPAQTNTVSESQPDSNITLTDEGASSAAMVSQIDSIEDDDRRAEAIAEMLRKGIRP